MSSPYARTIGGALKLKGGASLSGGSSAGRSLGAGAPSSSSSSSSAGAPKRARDAEEDAGLQAGPSRRSGPSEVSAAGAAGAAGVGAVSSSSAAAAAPAAQRVAGTGAIMTSGATVHGTGTRLLSEVSVGDALQIAQPLSGKLEVRVVKMVLSDASVGINAPFSSDLVSGTPFYVLKLPRVAEDPAVAAAAAAAKMRTDEAAAFGRYASEGGTKAKYLVKSGLGYKIKTETVAGGGATREGLLDLRVKNKSDKYA